MKKLKSSTKNEVENSIGSLREEVRIVDFDTIASMATYSNYQIDSDYTEEIIEFMAGKAFHTIINTDGIWIHDVAVRTLLKSFPELENVGGFGYGGDIIEKLKWEYGDRFIVRPIPNAMMETYREICEDLGIKPKSMKKTSTVSKQNISEDPIVEVKRNVTPNTDSSKEEVRIVGFATIYSLATYENYSGDLYEMVEFMAGDAYQTIVNTKGIDIREVVKAIIHDRFPFHLGTDLYTAKEYFGDNFAIRPMADEMMEVYRKICTYRGIKPKPLQRKSKKDRNSAIENTGSFTKKSTRKEIMPERAEEIKKDAKLTMGIGIEPEDVLIVDGKTVYSMLTGAFEGDHIPHIIEFMAGRAYQTVESTQVVGIGEVIKRILQERFPYSYDFEAFKSNHNDRFVVRPMPEDILKTYREMCIEKGVKPRVILPKKSS